MNLTGQDGGSGRLSRADRKVKESVTEKRGLPAEPRLQQLTAHADDISQRAEVNLRKTAVAVNTSVTSSSAMAERPRKLGDFKKARVNGGTDNQYRKDSHKCFRSR